MPGPNFIFAFIVATLFGAAFHLIAGGDARRLTMFLLAGWTGFGLGQMLGNTFPWGMLDIGELHLLPAAIGAIVALLLVTILSSGRSRRRSSR